MNAACFHAEPLLSIVVPCHHRTDLLRRCLETVTRFAPAGTEVIVVDDASPGGSASSVAGEFADVRPVRLERQSGFCVAANRGIAEARAPIVELLNDDTEVEPGWAEAAQARFSDPQVAAVAPLVLQLDGSPEPRIDSAGDRYHIGGFAAKRCRGQLASTPGLAAGPVFGASASSAFYRRELLLKVVGFPESFGSYFEDVDLSFRLRRAGGEIVFEPRSRVWHRVHASYGKPNRRLLEQQSRNEERVFWRNVPAGQMWRAIPLHAAVLLAKSWRRWREGRLLPFLTGRLRAAAEVRELLRHRRSLAALGPGRNLSNFLERGLDAG
jgi:GT2 family glycosyltransferase